MQLPSTIRKSAQKTTFSLAVGQRSLGPLGREFDLWPTLACGAPRNEADTIDYPLEITFDLAKVDTSLFEGQVGNGLTRWGPLLPPLVSDLSMGEGGTPLVRSPALEKW